MRRCAAIGSSSCAHFRSAGGLTYGNTTRWHLSRRCQRRSPCRRRWWGGKEEQTKNRRPPLSWPVALREVHSWLDPWVMLWRFWRAWSKAPPPPQLRALLDAVGEGHPLNVYVPI